jgi:hypothetical protein
LDEGFLTFKAGKTTGKFPPHHTFLHGRLLYSPMLIVASELKHLENSVPEGRRQLFQLRGRSNPEQAPLLEAPIRH